MLIIKYKLPFAVTLVLVLFLGLGLVSASDINTDDNIALNDNTNDLITTASNNDPIVEVDENNYDDNEEKNIPTISSKDNSCDVVKEDEVLNFTSLNDTINSNMSDYISLDNNYTYDDNFDAAFIKIGGIEISRDLTIDGQGHTIDCGGKLRFLVVNGHSITLKNINIINGYAKDMGGAVVISGANGSFINTTFTDNKASDGGAVFVTDFVNFINSTFINNTSILGGAVFINCGNGSFDNTKFINNTANVGGAIQIYEGNASFIDSLFTGNTALFFSGGAVYLNDGNGSFINTNFTGNSAKDKGGAVFNNGDLICINSTFVDNNAYHGGAVIVSFGNISSINSTFIGNNASSGGAVQLGEYGSFINTNLTGNTATDHSDNILCYMIDAVYIDEDTRLISDNNLIREKVNLILKIINFTYGSNGFLVYNVYGTYKGVISEGVLNLIIGNNTYAVDPVRGMGIIELKDLEAGNYNITAIYNGSSTYTDVINTVELSIYKKDVDMNIMADKIIYGDDALVQVFMYDLKDAEVYIDYDDHIYSVNLTDGLGVINISGLNAGNYTFDVVYSGNNNYNSCIKSINLTVDKVSTNILAKDASFIINYGGSYYVTVNTNVSGANVSFILNGKEIASAITDSLGLAKINLTAAQLKTLGAGSHNLIALFNGDNNHLPSNATAVIKISKESTKLLDVKSIKKTYKSTARTMQFTATLKDSKNKVIKSQWVYFKINNKKTYKVKTNTKGVAKLTLNAANIKACKLNKKGNYKFTVTYKTTGTYNQATKNGTLKVVL
ncbi:pectate lyase-like adhesive domain-containing protein [Methanobrevibacter sp.]